DSELRIKFDVRPLKEFAREELPVHSILRAVVLTEPNTMDLQTFLKRD
ncbi:unnamed protein product, partial [marine sediment metagenome]